MDLGAYFPYLNASNRSQEELFRLQFKLNEETIRIKKSFVSFVFDLKRNIEETSKMEDVITLLQFYDSNNFKELLSECKNLTEVFEKISHFVSFFDYDLIKLLTRKLGSNAIKKKLYKYKKKFQDFSKRRLCECPSNAFGDGADDKSEKVYVIKTDKSLESLTVNEVQTLERSMNRILGYEFLRLLRVEDGCVQLTFRTLRKGDMLPVPSQDRVALRKLGVLSIRFGGQIVDMMESPLQETVQEKESLGKQD